jgi:hypothetical protein
LESPGTQFIRNFLDFSITTRSIDRTAFLYKASTSIGPGVPDAAGSVAFAFGNHATRSKMTRSRTRSQTLPQKNSAVVEISFALRSHFNRAS